MHIWFLIEPTLFILHAKFSINKVDFQIIHGLIAFKTNFFDKWHMVSQSQHYSYYTMPDRQTGNSIY